MKRARFATLVVTGLFAASIAAPHCALAQNRVPAAVTFAHPEKAGDARILTYVSSERGFVTSSYILEGPGGLVVIDTQFLLSAAEEMIAWAEATTGKKVVLGLVLHPNPDKFNGAAVLNRRKIPVLTSAEVLAKLPAVHELRKSWFYEDFKPDYPADLPAVESFGDKVRTIEAAGLKLKLHVLGKGCSDAHVVVELDGHLFPGDLVTNDFHGWLELGYVEEWIARIEELKALSPDYVHPGRGPAGTADLLDQQAHYLRTVQALVKQARPHGPAKPAQLDALQQKIVAAFPGYRYSRFVRNGLDALWRRAHGKR